jgi:2-octaprenyl-6-methoxyphenol hydroxylase
MAGRTNNRWMNLAQRPPHAEDLKTHLAVIGAGPVGLALALLAAQHLPQVRVSLFDARPADGDVSGDPRTLALSLGSVQLLQRLAVWPQQRAEPILAVHVSQAAPTLSTAQVLITAQEQGVPQLGAVLRHGHLVAALQQAWQGRVQEQPQRLHTRFGTPVQHLKAVAGGVELDAGVAERFDLAVLAEGGAFGQQARKALHHDYAQTAWVGTVALAGAAPGAAFEHFTHGGPLALLPLPAAQGASDRETQPPDTRAAALVWCTRSEHDDVAELDTARRLTLLNALLPSHVGRVVAVSALKRFPLGLNAERSLVQGRTVRIGNAAQTLHPVAGQGLNLGLRDAFELVQRLGRQPSIDAALRGVEWSRAPDRYAMIAATDFLARSFTWRWPGVATARALGLAAVQALPPARRLLARQMMFGSR